MREIKSSCGRNIIVDDNLYDWLNTYNWYAVTSKTTKIRYAATSIKRKKVLMHRMILYLNKNQIADHINGNGLDNRKENLRISNKSTNGMNRSKQLNNTSGYKGVSFRKERGIFRAFITSNKKTYFLGHFVSEKEAAKAYNEAALKYHGEFACLNIIKE